MATEASRPAIEAAGALDSSSDRKPLRVVSAPERRRAFARSTTVWAAWTLVSRVSGFVREVLLARAFGTSPAASALVVAQTVPLFSRSLVAEDAARGALLPVLSEQVLERREREAWMLTWIAAAWTTLLMLGVAGIVWATATWCVSVLSSGITDAPEFRREAARILHLLVPMIIVNGVGAASSAYLVARKRFAIAGAATALPNAPLIVGLLLISHPSIDSAARLVVLGVLLQIALQALAAVTAHRAAPPSARPAPVDFAAVRRRMREVAFLALPVVLSIGIGNFSGLVDIAFSGFVSAGGPAALDKALRLMLVPYGIFAVAIGVVGMPTLVEAAVGGSRPSFDEELFRICRMLFALLLPLAAVLEVFPAPIVSTIYQHGVFDRNSTRLTVTALAGMAAVLPAMGLSLVGSRAWLSRKRPWVPGGVLILRF